MPLAGTGFWRAGGRPAGRGRNRQPTTRSRSMVAVWTSGRGNVLSKQHPSELLYLADEAFSIQ